MLKIQIQKRKFDASNPLDRKIARDFLERRSWSNITRESVCPFNCEWPYLDIPSMLRDKLLKYYFQLA